MVEIAAAPTKTAGAEHKVRAKALKKSKGSSSESSLASLHNNDSRKTPTNFDFAPIASPNASLTCSKTLTQIQQIQQARDERRARHAEERKKLEGLSAADQANLIFKDLIQDFKSEFDAQCDELGEAMLSNEASGGKSLPRIRVCVRKRPMNSAEFDENHFDVISVKTATYPFSHVYVHEPKSRVDMSKHVEHHQFVFDNSFDDTAHNELIYRHTAKPLVEAFLKGGKTTFFAYGQTGSGKTHTIFGKKRDPGVFVFCCQDVWGGFAQRYLTAGAPQTGLFVSFFEIYGGKIYDLLNEKARLELLEDASGNFIVDGLTHIKMEQLADLLNVHEIGSQLRTTGSTKANATSSRSHAVFQITVMNLADPESGTSRGNAIGKFSLIDLAGSERGAETGDNIPRHLRTEGAEINKSLLALKECIRMLHQSQQRQNASGLDVDGYTDLENDQHIPFRASKLTQILRDSLISKNGKTVMMATVSPSDGVVEHTLNTLRYADRVKQFKQNQNPLVQTVSVLPKSTQGNLEGALASDRKVSNSSVGQVSDLLRPRDPHNGDSNGSSGVTRGKLASGSKQQRQRNTSSSSSSGASKPPKEAAKLGGSSHKSKESSKVSDGHESLTKERSLASNDRERGTGAAGGPDKSTLHLDRLYRSHHKILSREEEIISLEKRLLQQASQPNFDKDVYVAELEDLLLAKVELIRTFMRELKVCKKEA